MKLTTMRFLIGLIVFGTIGYFFWPVGSPQTPEQTVVVAQQAIQDHDWDRLYDLTHSDFREKRIGRWREHLRSILKRGVDSRVSPTDIDELDHRQIFRTFLESLSRDPRVQRMLKAYGSAGTSIQQTSDEARVDFESPAPLPHQTVYLKKEENLWRLHSFN